ncbi:MAG: type IV pilus assembly protein PilQ, partial [bacterium]
VNDVPWNQVVESIFRANQLSSTREGLIVRVATLPALAQEQTQKRALEEERNNALPKQTKFFRLKYIRLGSSTVGGGGTGALGGTQAASNLGGQGNTAGIGATGLVGIILKTLSKLGQVDADFRTNQIIVTDLPQNVLAVEDIIKKLDVPEPQVEIEARVVLANRSFSRTIGNQLALAATQSRSVGPIDPITGARKIVQGFGAIFETSPQVFSNPIRTDAAGAAANGNNVGSGGLIGPVANGALAGGGASILSLTTGVIGTSLLSTALTASEQKGVAKTISNPRVTVQNNTPADITSGTQIAVQTEVNNTITTTFVTAALRLNVIPQIADEGNVLMRIIVENNSVDRSLRTTGGTPSISTQRAETLVLVPDGGTTILGGINFDTEASTNTRTPGVARVPFLGELFKRRSLDRS